MWGGRISRMWADVGPGLRFSLSTRSSLQPVDNSRNRRSDQLIDSKTLPSLDREAKTRPHSSPVSCESTFLQKSSPDLMVCDLSARIPSPSRQSAMHSVYLAAWERA